MHQREQGPSKFQKGSIHSLRIPWMRLAQRSEVCQIHDVPQ